MPVSLPRLARPARCLAWLALICLAGPAAAAGPQVQADVAAEAPRAPEADVAATVTPVASALAKRWDATFAAFDEADLANPPPPGGVVFVGSSSIRLWSGLEQQFQLAPVVLKRGFGGSTMQDCAEHLQRLVLPYRPRLVVVYAGDNDLAQGRSPQEVLGSFTAFVDGVRQALPDTRIAYVSIKPSPSRSSLLPQVRETNALIERYAREAEQVDFIDVYTPMLGPDGQPRSELFGADALHLNAAGYQLWRTVIGSHLK